MDNPLLFAGRWLFRMLYALLCIFCFVFFLSVIFQSCHQVQEASRLFRRRWERLECVSQIEKEHCLRLSIFLLIILVKTASSQFEFRSQFEFLMVRTIDRVTTYSSYNKLITTNLNTALDILFVVSNSSR